MYLGTHARERPDKIALIRAATGESMTFAELDARSTRLVRALRAAGLVPGDTLAFYLDNGFALFETVFACLRAGLYATPVNRHLAAPEAAYIVADCDAKALIASATLDQSAALGNLSAACSVKLAVGGALPGFADYDAALAARHADKLPDETLGAFMFYSSGTTGRPKGIRRPLSGLPVEGGARQIGVLCDRFGIGADSLYLAPNPLYHSAPAAFAIGTVQSGGTCVFMDRFEPEPALAAIERHRITHSLWVPTMFIRMLKLPDEVKARYDLSSQVSAIHAAAPCPAEVKRRMIDWWGPVIEEFYSSSEGAGFARIGSADWLAHPGSVGRAQGAPFHICDEAGRELPPGEIGLIYGEAPPGAAFTYHKDVEKTAGAAHPAHPTWTAVGDIGYLDADGYLYLTDRKSFMIISGGVNIYPQQIEDALALHPAIADVAVIGVPNEELGEEVKAVIEPAPGVMPSDALADALKAFVRERLGKQLTPRTIDFTDALPRLPTGKLYKQALRDLYWPGPSAEPHRAI